MPEPPVIIIGMHRSGTSLMARLLEGLGIFMGSSLSIHHEAKYFLGLNIWILKQLNSNWDTPPNLNIIDVTLRRKIIDYLRQKMHSLSRIGYIGFKNIFKYKDIRDIDFPWGWKDPRNSFTIDFWLDFFPKAKIIHVYRNPIDVAVSLKKREEAFITALKKRSIIKKILLFYRREYVAKGLLNIENGVKLWEKYLYRIKQFEESYNNDILHIKYEGLLQQPTITLKEVEDFLEIKNPQENINKIISKIDPEKSYRFLKNRDLVQEYYKIKNKPLLKYFGYDNLVC